jgi:ligand-binding sensor domain-containing protein
MTRTTPKNTSHPWRASAAAHPNIYEQKVRNNRATVLLWMASGVLSSRFRALLIASTFAVYALPLHSQPTPFAEAWRWARFSTESGLPSNHITKIFETSDSVVWVATPKGPAWFDGYQWIQLKRGNSPGSSADDALRDVCGGMILVSNKGKVYLGTRDSLVLLPLEGIESAYFLSLDSILIAKQSSLFLYHNGLLTPFLQNDGISKGKALKIQRSAGGSLWAKFPSGLYRWNGRWQLLLSAKEVTGTFFAENGRGSGIVGFGSPQELAGIWEWYDHSRPRLNKRERPGTVRALDINQNADALIAYQSGDVRMRTSGIWRSVHFKEEVTDSTWLKFRRNGDFWVGTSNGLYLYRQSDLPWQSRSHPPLDQRNYVNEFLKTRDGSLWIATGDGIEILLPDSSVKRIRSIQNTMLYAVTGLIEDVDGHVWISSGSSFSGAFRWDGRQWQHFQVAADSGEMKVHKIKKDRRDRLWFLGINAHYPQIPSYQPGAYVYEHGTFTRWGVPEGLNNGRVYAFDEAADGSLWFGTFQGLCQWKDGNWRYWSKAEGLRTNRVFTLAVDQENNVWFGDYSEPGYGLGYIGKDRKVTYLGRNEGLSDERILDVKIDRFNALWISTQNGMSCYDAGNWITFDRNTGLHHSALWSIMALDSIVYVGTQGKGWAILDRTHLKSPSPRILLDDARTSHGTTLLRWRVFAYWGERPSQRHSDSISPGRGRLAELVNES